MGFLKHWSEFIKFGPKNNHPMVAHLPNGTWDFPIVDKGRKTGRGFQGNFKNLRSWTEENESYKEKYQQEKEAYLQIVEKEKHENEAIKLLKGEQMQKTAMELLEQFCRKHFPLFISVKFMTWLFLLLLQGAENEEGEKIKWVNPLTVFPFLTCWRFSKKFILILD